MKPISLLKMLIFSAVSAVILLSCAIREKSAQASTPIMITKKDTSLDDRHPASLHPALTGRWVIGSDDSNKVVSEIVVDDAGTYFVTGYISGTVIEGEDTLMSCGGNDIFLARYDEQGNLVWIKTAGGYLDEAGNSIASDAHGNMYVTGYFYGEITFDTITIDSHGLEDMFIAKYDPFGHCLWAKSIGGEGDDTGLDISVDANLNGVNGTIHVAGSFSGGKATFGDKEVTSKNDEQYFNADFTAAEGVFKSISMIQ